MYYRTKFFFKAAALKAFGLELLSVEKDHSGPVVFIFEYNKEVLNQYEMGEGSVSPLSVVNALSELKIKIRQATCS